MIPLKIILSMLLSSIILYSVENNTSKGLFIDMQESQNKSLQTKAKGDDKIKRSRTIDIDMNLLPQTILSASIGEELSLVLNLFDDVQYIAKIKNISKSSATATTIWSGTIEGMEYSHISIASTDGVIAGSIRLDDGRFFKIIYDISGTHRLQEIEESNMPKELTPLEPKIPLGVTDRLTVPTDRLDTGAIIDIMVVYTPSARLAAGGQAAIESIINASVATMNTTFTNSNIATQVRLVHTAEVVYSRGETGRSSGFNTALDDLTDTTDGYMDTIHALRDTYSADMVQLFFNNSSSGGLAWVMTNPSAGFEANAFSVVHYNYADGGAFDHEFGHNMGMKHERSNSTFEGSYSYSYGYQSPTNAWHTLMAYSCAGGCPRIDYWSNPAITYNGESIGIPIGAIDEADAKATITNNLSIIANWRTVPSPSPDLIIASMTSSATSVTSGQSVVLNTSVLNQGNAVANSSTLRYYLSLNSTINSSDTELSNTIIGSLNIGGNTIKSANITVPTSAGTYYLGACVDSVATELATANNCSSGIQIRVALDTDRDGIADSIDSDDDNDGLLDTVELRYGLNPLNASDASADFDNDGFSNSIEIKLGTDIRSALSKPSWAPILMDGGLIILAPVNLH